MTRWRICDWGVAIPRLVIDNVSSFLFNVVYLFSFSSGQRTKWSKTKLAYSHDITRKSWTRKVKKNTEENTSKFNRSDTGSFYKMVETFIDFFRLVFTVVSEPSSVDGGDCVDIAFAIVDLLQVSPGMYLYTHCLCKPFWKCLSFHFLKGCHIHQSNIVHLYLHMGGGQSRLVKILILLFFLWSDCERRSRYCWSRHWT
jgi:hypothetical protein